MKKWNEAEIVELNISETAVNTNPDDHKTWVKELWYWTDINGDGYIGHQSWGNYVGGNNTPGDDNGTDDEERFS